MKKDIQAIISLNKFIHNDHYQRNPEIFKEFNYAKISKSLEEYINRENNNCFIAYEDEQPIGYAVVNIRQYQNHLFQDYHCSLYIQEMCVNPEYQKKGIGERIMEEIICFSEEKGISRIELSVWSNNINAKSFYKKMGFDTYLENMTLNIAR